MKYVATVSDDSRAVEVSGRDGRYRVALGDQVWEVDDAMGDDGQEYDLKLDRSYRIIKRERD